MQRCCRQLQHSQLLAQGQVANGLNLFTLLPQHYALRNFAGDAPAEGQSAFGVEMRDMT